MKPGDLITVFHGHKWWTVEIRFDHPLTVRQQRAATKAVWSFCGSDPFLVGRDGVLVRLGRWPGRFEALELVSLPARLGPYRFRAHAECGEPRSFPCARCDAGGPFSIPWVRVDQRRVR